MFRSLNSLSLVPYAKYGSALNSHDLIKAIAITLMILDHIGYYFMPYMVELRLVGRFSFPLFFFLIGYSHNYRFKWDVLILFLLIVMQDAFLNIPIFPANILGNVILSRIALLFLDRWQWSRENVISLSIVLVLGSPLIALFVDFGVFGMVMALCGYFVRTHPGEKVTIGFLGLTCLAYGVLEIATFHFSLAYSIIFITGLILLFLVLYHYRLQTYSHLTDTNPIIHVIMAFSRYSLYIYALHLMAFKLIKVIEYPELYTQFRWV